MTWRGHALKVYLMTVTLTAACLVVVGHGPGAPQGFAATRLVNARSAGETPNPHWDPDGCQLCHGEADRFENDRPVYRPIPHEAIDALCWRCHDGVAAAREVHPVGRYFASEQVYRPTEWPTVEGKLSCVTCHDILTGCFEPHERPTANPDFLREDGSGDLLHFCAQCHVAAVTARVQQYNPHVMLDNEGRIIRQVCLFCHEEGIRLDREGHRTGQAALRTDGITLCVNCHGTHIDYFEPGHIGHIASEQIIANMLRAESLPHARPTDAPVSEKKDALPQRLPLGPDRRIECATCHNPHQAGMFEEGTVLGWGGIVPDRDEAHLALRGYGRELCWVCHDR